MIAIDFIGGPADGYCQEFPGMNEVPYTLDCPLPSGNVAVYHLLIVKRDGQHDFAFCHKEYRCPSSST